VPRLVLASSSSVYGIRSAIPFHEDDPCDTPASPYAATKRAMEILAYAHHAIHGAPLRCLRFFTVYGPRQRPEMAIAHFARRIARGEPITLYGDGQSARDYTFIDDIVTGVVASLARADAGYRVYNLGGTRTTTLLHLVELLEDALGRKARVVFEPDRQGDVPITCASVARAEAELGYRPTVPIEEGITRYVAWGHERRLWA
jgi:UDP-glucuronate 4-epimerase